MGGGGLLEDSSRWDFVITFQATAILLAVIFPLDSLKQSQTIHCIINCISFLMEVCNREMIAYVRKITIQKLVEIFELEILWLIK